MGEQRLGAEKEGENLFSVREAADFLNISLPFVVEQVESGRLPSRVAGSASLIRAEDVRAFRATLRQGTEAALQALADEGQELGI